MIEKTKLSFTRYISGMQGLSYPERDTLLFMFGNLSLPICSRTSDCRGRACITSHVGVGRLGHLRLIALDGVPSACLTNYLCSYVIQLYVLFIVSTSRRNLIYIYLHYSA